MKTPSLPFASIAPRRAALRALASLPLAGLLQACGGGGDGDPAPALPMGPDPAPAPPTAPPTQDTRRERLRANLVGLQAQRNTLIGHQGTTTTGVGWRLGQQPAGHSDFQQSCGKYPAVYGWELGFNPNDPSMNWDGTLFVDLIEEAKRAHARGGLNTFCLHPHRIDKPYVDYNNGGAGDTSLGNQGQYPNYVSRINQGGDLHAQYLVMLDHWAAVLTQLKADDGTPIPFVLRPYHEADGAWFWWGANTCSALQYRMLFNFAVDHLRDTAGLTQMLTCYSPGIFQTADDYLSRYPADDTVDILGYDGYLFTQGFPTPIDQLASRLQLTCRLALEKGKIAAWTETGMQNLADAQYFSKLDQMLNSLQVAPAYLMFWANYDANQFYVPYPGAPQALTDDFTQFTQRANRLVQGDHGDLYAA